MSVILEGDANIFLITEAAKPQVKQRNNLFIICDDCFWVASALNARYFDPVTCPACGKRLSSLPISNDERYTFSNKLIRGVELDFYSENRSRR